MRASRLSPKATKLAGVRSNVGLQQKFKRKLVGLISEMNTDVLRTIASYLDAGEARIAQDALADDMIKVIGNIRQRWLQQFESMAQALAEHFAEESMHRSDAALRAILRRGGFSVRFRMTPEMREVLQATIAEQVGLIKSIPAKYLDGVEQAVMRSIQLGRDLEGLSKELRETYGSTKKRAALIARDQNNKATGSMVRARQMELGISRAVWRHSHAGKKPRRTHVKMDGKTFNIEEGMWDSDEGAWVHPGELINCRCFSQPIILGLEKP